jgi:hypothetical protein
MKFKLLLLSAILGSQLAIAQQNVQCGSHIYLQNLDKQYPGFENYVNNLAQLNATNSNKTRASVVYIPVVVHIVYNSATENLTDDYVNAQIDLLNRSFARTNSDTTNMRSVFNPIVGKANIQFVLDQIKHVSTTHGQFIMDFTWNGYNTADDVKQTNAGGSDAVMPDKKMNLWVCDLGIPGGQGELLGYAYPPSGLSNWGPNQGFPSVALDGVVIDYMVFGGSPTKNPKGFASFGARGKTAVHEVGHYLGLRHIWADDNGTCTQDDGISDTPKAEDASPSNCDKVINSCVDPGTNYPDMVENYMDYSLETCQNSFTKGQATHMEAVLANQRIQIRVPVGLENYSISNNVSVYPNPATDQLKISIYNIDYKTAYLSLKNSLGQEVFNSQISSTDLSAQISTSTLAKGIYFLTIKLDNNKGYHQQKISIQ